MKHSGISQLTIDKQEKKLEQQLKEELGLNTNHSYWKPYLTHQKKKKNWLLHVSLFLYGVNKKKINKHFVFEKHRNILASSWNIINHQLLGGVRFEMSHV